MSIGSSPLAGGVCETCLRKFTIHFRHDEEKYDGSYGFDWLRFEHVNPIAFLRLNEQVKKDGFAKTFLGDIQKLKFTYTNGQKTKISPFGAQYSPAWLSMYATTKNNISTVGSSKINKNGVFLNLELIALAPENSKPIYDDGTIIELVSSNKNLTVYPSKFNLSELLLNYKNRVINKVTEERQYYYESKNIINIKCQNGVLENDEEINVYAYKKSVKEKVGKLMIYRNSKVPKMSLRIIDFITDGSKRKRSKDYEYFLKYKCFNQALIRPEVELDSEFDLRKFKNVNDPNGLVNDFLELVNSKKAFETSELDYLSANILIFFERYGGKDRIKDQVGNYINYDGHNKTYIFLTTINCTEAAGYAPLEFYEYKKAKFGNVVIIFQSNEDFNLVLAHELAHSLGLPHIFDKTIPTMSGRLANQCEFVRGYSGNIMDYGTSLYYGFEGKRQEWPNNKDRNYFFKFQWDLMRKDRSLKY